MAGSSRTGGITHDFGSRTRRESASERGIAKRLKGLSDSSSASSSEDRRSSSDGHDGEVGLEREESGEGL